MSKESDVIIRDISIAEDKILEILTKLQEKHEMNILNIYTKCAQQISGKEYEEIYQVKISCDFSRR